MNHGEQEILVGNKYYEAILRNLSKQIMDRKSVLDMAAEFGVGQFVVAYGSRPSQGVSISIPDLAKYLAVKKAAFYEVCNFLRCPPSSRKRARKYKTALLTQVHTLEKIPAVEQVLAKAPARWLTNPQAADYVGVSRAQLGKLIVKYTAVFQQLFNGEVAHKFDTIDHGAIVQHNIKLHNRLFIGLITWYEDYLKTPIEVGSKTIHALALSLGVDFETVDRVVQRYMLVEPALGKYGKVAKSTTTFFCTPRLVALVEKELQIDPPPDIVIAGYRWSTAEQVGRLRGDNSGQRARIIAHQYEVQSPELILPFKMQGYKITEYIHPTLVRKILEEHPARKASQKRAGVAKE